MNILLVQPRDEAMAYSPKRPLMGLAYLAASLEKVPDSKIKILDMRLKDYSMLSDFTDALKNFKPNIVGFTLQPMTLRNALNMAKIVKEKTSAYTIAGGPEVTLLPKEALSSKYIDFIMVGDGDRTFPELIGKLKNGNWKNIKGLGYKENNKMIINPRDILEDLDELPIPAWDYFPLRKYKRNISKIQFPILTSKGCPYQCAYCPSAKTTKKYQVRSAKNIVNEMEHIYRKYGANNFQIVDDNFAVIKQRVFDFCNLLIERKLNFRWSVGQGFGANHADYEMFKLMKKAGCYMISIGVESADEDVLKLARKPATKKQIAYALKSAKKAGLTTKANFICGLPGSTYEKEMKSIAFFKEMKVDMPRYCNIMVFPTTYVYDWVKEKARILVDNIDDIHNIYSGTAGSQRKKDATTIVFETKEFPKEDRIKAYEKCLSESMRWSSERMFGKYLGYIVWQLSKIKLVRTYGEKILDYFGKT